MLQFNYEPIIHSIQWPWPEASVSQPQTCLTMQHSQTQHANSSSNSSNSSSSSSSSSGGGGSSSTSSSSNSSTTIISFLFVKLE